MNRDKQKYYILLMAVLLIWTLAYKTFYKPKLIVFRTLALDTLVEVKYKDNSSDQEKVKRDIEDVLEHIEKELSVYRKDSLVSIFNKEKIITTNAVLEYVLNKSYEISDVSDGAFDITSQPLINLWREAVNSKLMPTKEEIDEARNKVDYRHVQVKQGYAVMRKNTTINLGGIAKGYAIDLVANALKSNNIFNAIINIGGDIRVLGSGPKYKGWVVGIAHPREKGRLIAEVTLKNKAIATSGDYERYSMVNGKRISHIVDPRSGYTVSDLPASVTIIAADATYADGLATAVYVLGVKDGLGLVNKLENVEAMLVDSKGNAFYSENWEYKKKANVF